MSGVKRYQNPELYEALAAEYVLGTLTGAAHRRFERLIAERPYIRHAVEMWEQKLNPMAELVPEAEPPARVWNNIRQAIAQDAGAASGRERQGAGWLEWLRRPAFWQATTAILAVALGLKTLLPLVADPAPMPTLAYISVLEGEGDKPMAVTMGDRKRRVVSVRLMEKPKLAGEHVLELWAIKSPDSKPVRVGIVPPDRKTTYLRLSEQEWKKMKGAKQFAITFEPKNRAESEEPTGPIMYKGKCIDFI